MSSEELGRIPRRPFNYINQKALKVFHVSHKEATRAEQLAIKFMKSVNSNVRITGGISSRLGFNINELQGDENQEEENSNV